jgi:hypothetical protein
MERRERKDRGRGGREEGVRWIEGEESGRRC